MTDQRPDWLKNFTEACEQAGAEISKSIEQATDVLAAQAAMGWMYRGDLTNARAAIAGVAPDKLLQVSAAATALAAIADERLQELS
jgi:hypothetical protein